MRRQNRIAIALTFGLAFTGLLAFGMTQDATEIRSPLLGRAAPQFALETLEGRDTVSLASLRGTPVVVNFWASWCLACRDEHPALVRAWQRHELQDEQIRLLGIVYQDSRGNARRYMQELGGDWTILMDPGTRTAIEFGVYGVPETYFINAGGRIIHKQTGPVTDEVLDQWIARLLVADNSAVADAPLDR